MDPKFLKLTKADEQIYGDFRKTFGDLKIDVLDPEELKSEPAKEVGTEGGLELQGWGPGTPPNFPKNPIPRSGAPSACASRGWWRTSTTAPCCAWTAARATRRRTRYLVSPKTSLSACF